jgi:hypothetical protein
MGNKTLEVLGIGPLREHAFLVYFSDHTYATISAEKLAECFPIRHVIPEAVTEDFFSESTFHANRLAYGESLNNQTN